MAKTCHDILITWLNNAYAIELSLIKTLEAHAEDAKDLPDMQQAIQEHIGQTKSQADRVKSAIEQLGGDVSSIKSGGATVMGYMQGAMPELADDKIVKNALAEHASEHLEMASYMAIVKAAEMCGEPEVTQMARDIVEEETKMAEKIKMSLGRIVETYIHRETEEGGM